MIYGDVELRQTTGTQAESVLDECHFETQFHWIKVCI